MIAVLCSWFVMAVTCLMWGEVFVSLYNRITKSEERYAAFELLTIGLCVVGAIVGLSSLFLPSGVGMMLALLILPFLILIVTRRFEAMFVRVSALWQSLSKWQVLFSVISLLAFLLFVIMPPQFPDTFIYHIQHIMWNEEFRVLPGVANLQHRFGFNSNFFLLSSVYGMKPLWGQIIFGVNALYMLSLLIYIICRSADWGLPKTLLSLAVFGCAFYQYGLHIASPSTDLLPNLLIISLLLFLMESDGQIKNKTLLFWIVPVFCITLKLSTALICVICIFILIGSLKRKYYKKLVFLLVSALVVILPWLIRNVIISGYLIFPYPAIDWFNPDWKVPVDILLGEKNYIKAFAISIDAMDGKTDMVLAWPFELKLRKWLGGLSYFELGFIVMLVLSPFAVLRSYLKGRASRVDQTPFLYILWRVALISVIFCLLQAPAFRFFFGFVIAAVAIPIYLYVRNIPVRVNTARLCGCIILLFVLAVSAYSLRYLRSIKHPHISLQHLILKPQPVDYSDFKKVQTLEQTEVGGITFNIATKGNCIDCQLPCMEYSNDWVIEPRGENITDGFRVVKR